MIADELRRQADVFTDLVELQSKLGRNPSERPAPVKKYRAIASSAAVSEANRLVLQLVPKLHQHQNDRRSALGAVERSTIREVVSVWQVPHARRMLCVSSLECLPR